VSRAAFFRMPIMCGAILTTDLLGLALIRCRKRATQQLDLQFSSECTKRLSGGQPSARHGSGAGDGPPMVGIPIIVQIGQCT
jgi:hypothetical protein